MLVNWSLKRWGAISMLLGVVVGAFAVFTPYFISVYDSYTKVELYQILRNLPVGCLTASSLALFIGGAILAISDKTQYRQEDH